MILHILYVLIDKQKWKSHNSNVVIEKRYDNNMNSPRVIIKNVYWVFKK
jgi:hypothetical protein